MFYSKPIEKEIAKYRAYIRTIYKQNNDVGESLKHILSSFDLLENVAYSLIICLCVHKQQHFQKEKS